MKKWNVADWTLLGAVTGVLLIYLGIQFFSGEDVNGFLAACLIFTAAFCAQMLVCRLFRWKSWLLILTVLFGLWGVWCYYTSEAWQYAAFTDLFTGYLTPVAGGAAAWAVWKAKK